MAGDKGHDSLAAGNACDQKRQLLTVPKAIRQKWNCPIQSRRHLPDFSLTAFQLTVKAGLEEAFQRRAIAAPGLLCLQPPLLYFPQDALSGSKAVRAFQAELPLGLQCVPAGSQKILQGPILPEEGLHGLMQGNVQGILPAIGSRIAPQLLQDQIHQSEPLRKIPCLGHGLSVGQKGGIRLPCQDLPDPIVPAVASIQAVVVIEVPAGLFQIQKFPHKGFLHGNAQALIALQQPGQVLPAPGRHIVQRILVPAHMVEFFRLQRQIRQDRTVKASLCTIGQEGLL